MPHRYENIDFKRTFDNIPDDIKKILQKQEDEQNLKDFLSLKENLEMGKCYLCGKSIEENSEENPCFHVLLNPKLKKKIREALFAKQISFIKLYTYLAWVANTENPFFNVNDSLNDIASNRLFESTIRYKNIEWSFSFKKSDMEGHKGKKVGESPHYHFQMTVDKKIIASFNNCHLYFTPYDFFMFEMIKQEAAIPDSQFASGIEFIKNAVEVIGFPDGSYRSLEVISEEEIQHTIILPETCSHEQIQEIIRIFQSSQLRIHQIIDKLNKEKGYKILYLIGSQKLENPVYKKHRD